MMAARTMIEGDAAASVAAIGRVPSSAFSDPEGLLYHVVVIWSGR